MGQEVVGYGASVNDGTGDALHIAFAKLDAAARSFTVIDKDLTAPPGGPAVGDAYIVGGAATGAWSGEGGNIAVFGLASTWRFITAVEGMLAWAQDENAEYRYSGTAWATTASSEGSSGALTPFDRGAVGSGTETPEPGEGAMQIATNGGAHTLAAPTTTGAYVLTYTNGLAAGAITASGWDSITDAGAALAHTAENSVIECAAYNDGVSKRLIVTLIEDASGT